MDELGQRVSVFAAGPQRRRLLPSKALAQPFHGVVVGDGASQQRGTRLQACSALKQSGIGSVSLRIGGGFADVFKRQEHRPFGGLSRLRHRHVGPRGAGAQGKTGEEGDQAEHHSDTYDRLTVWGKRA